MDESLLQWQELPEDLRAALERKLKGLYGHEQEESAFNSLSVDKQQALLLFVRRLRQLRLWHAVQSIENIYGWGGVGMNFKASALFASVLQRRREFTTFFAARRKNYRGFFERHRSCASLHFAYLDPGRRHWGVHFDLYSPLGSPVSASRHLFHEKLRIIKPDWRMIKKMMNDEC